MDTEDFKVGDTVVVIERTNTDEEYYWNGKVLDIKEHYIETVHRRNPVLYPQWLSGENYFRRAYLETTIKHFTLDLIKKT